jgi:hypothetical protein
MRTSASNFTVAAPSRWPKWAYRRLFWRVYWRVRQEKP